MASHRVSYARNHLHPNPLAEGEGTRGISAPSIFTRWSVASLAATLGGCVLGWALIAAACLCVGSTSHGFHWPANVPQLRIRLEVVLLASLVGAALGAAGATYQAVLRNGLADPYLLGVSSGASLATFIWRIVGTGLLASVIAALGEQAFAFAGGLAAVAVVFGLAAARRRFEPLTLILVGVVVNAINGSIFLLLETVGRDPTGQTGGPLSFLVGGLQTNLTTAQEFTAGALVGGGVIGLILLSGSLNVVTLDDAEARSLGVRIGRLRWLALGVASLTTASAVAVSGPIGFVGLVGPHLAGLLVGSDLRRRLPVAAAAGAAMLALADAASRALSRPDLAATQLPVGVLTGLLGGPFFLFLLLRRSRSA